MSVIEMISSIQQIQSRIASLSGSTQSTSDDTSSSSATFDQLVSSLTASGSTASTAAATTSISGATTGSGAVTGDDVVADAKKYLGVPYVLGGESTSGMDCSGLVQKTFKDLGIDIPRLVHTQAPEGTAVASLAQAKPGDLIVFKGNKHIAIYAGNGMVIHAPYPGRTVSLQKLWVGDSGIETIRRIVPSSDSVSASTASAASLSSSLSATSGSTSSSSASAVLAAQTGLQADIATLTAITSTFGGMGGNQ